MSCTKAGGLQDCTRCQGVEPDRTGILLHLFFIFLNLGLIEDFLSGKLLVEYVFEAHCGFLVTQGVGKTRDFNFSYYFIFPFLLC